MVLFFGDCPGSANEANPILLHSMMCIIYVTEIETVHLTKVNKEVKAGGPTVCLVLA